MLRDIESSAIAHCNASTDSQESVLHRINSLSHELQSGLNSLAKIAASGRTVATTAEAAHALDFQPQTLRRWACYDCGPIRPVRVGSRLRWKIADIVALLEGGAHE